MPERSNFYLLLELAPSVDDWSVIERRIQEKQREWSRDRSMGNPRARRHAESSLALLHEIRSVLANPEMRRAEAQDAIRRQEKERQGRLRELDEAIALLKSSGAPCTDSHLGRLVERFAGTFDKAQIRARLRAAGVPLANDAAPAPHLPGREVIAKVTAHNIRENLDHLGLVTLYDFLGLPPTSSPRSLSDRAGEIYRENQRLGRTDAATSARNALAGICKSVFQNDHEKAKYDQHLVIEAMGKLEPNLELAGADRFIGREVLEALIRQAGQRGVSPEDARAFIEDYATARQWRIERVPAPLPKNDLPRGPIQWLRSVPPPQVKNVTSKSFGIRIADPQGQEVVANLICIDEPVPRTSSLRIENQEEGLRSMKLHCMENLLAKRQVDLSECREIGQAIIEFGRPLPRGSIVEVAFDLGPDGLLTIRAKDLSTGATVSAEFRTEAVLSSEQLEAARRRNLALSIGKGKGMERLLARKQTPQEMTRREQSLRPRDQVFISYSRKDKNWLEHVQKMLKPLVRQGSISLWDDTRLKPGEDWKQEIERALASARVAILLVSSNFMASDFIAEDELPPLLKAAWQKGLVILWVCLGPCLYEEIALSQYQAVHDPAKPLSSLRKPQWEKVLAELARQVKKVIQSPPSTPLEASSR